MAVEARDAEDLVDRRAAIEREAREEMRAATATLIDRIQWARQAGISFNGLRDLYDILGYDRVITAKQYRDRYARGGIAGRVVDALPNATWRGGIELVEDLDPKVSTEFEKACAGLDNRLHLWATLLRVDKMAGLSTFAALLIGVAGDESLSEPLPKGRKPEDLLYFSPFTGAGYPAPNGGVTGALDASCTIAEFESDTRNPRFGLPRFYQLRRTMIGTTALNVPVHWTRVLHVAEGLLEDDVFGPPTLERVWNYLDDLDKVSGGGSEAFWLRANKGLQIDIDKDVKTLSVDEKASLTAQIEDYKHQITRILRTRGTKINELGSDVANFSNPVDSLITLIAGSKAIPKRILTGSEQGELASSQDRDNWRDQVNGRQTGYAAPFIVRPLIDRLIEYGYLPKPKQYEVKWAHIQTLTESEKAEGAAKWASTNSTQGAPVFTDAEIREHWYGLEPLTQQQIEEQQKIKAAGQPTVNPQEGAVEPGDLLDPQELKAAGGVGSGIKGHTTAEKKELHNAETTLNDILGGPTKSAQVRKRANIDVLKRVKTADLHRLIDAFSAVERIGGTKSYALDRVKAELASRLSVAETHSYASTQINLTGALREKILALGRLISEADLAEDGREANPHVTVKYGLLNDEGLVDLVAGFGPVVLTLGKTGVFEAEEYDVVQVAVDSPDLHRLNGLICAGVACVDTQPYYQPHATVAYVKKGLGLQWAGLEVHASMVADRIEFSPKDGTPYDVALRHVFQSLTVVPRSAEDVELIRVLEAAILVDNQDVVNRIICGFRTADNPNHEPAGSNKGGQFASKSSDGLFGTDKHIANPGDDVRYHALKAKWANVNNELLNFIDDPHSVEAEEKLAELKGIVKEIYRLRVDEGGIEGIGQPGGPRDVVIIGAGPGGLTSAVMAGTDGLDALIVDGSHSVGGQAKLSSRIENYPGFPVGTSGQNLADRLHDQALRVGSDERLGVRAVGISYDPKTEMKIVTLSNGETIETRSVIIAAGIEPQTMKFPGSESDSIIYSDSDRLRKEGAGKAIAVIGGSNGAAQAALGAARTASSVTLVSRSPIRQSMSDYQINALQNHPKITVVEGDEIQALVHGENGRMALVTKGGRTIDAERTGVFIGGSPKLDWLPKEIEIKGKKVVVDGNLETSIPGVFAVGDSRHGSIGRIGTAVGDGQIAVRSAFTYFYKNRGKMPEHAS